MSQSVAHVEKGPAVIDDVVVVTNNIKDLKRVNEVSARYEEQSVMMLSRTEKSKEMFLGSWKWRATRPRLPVWVEYLQEVKQLKVLGLTIIPFQNNSTNNMGGEDFKAENAVDPVEHQIPAHTAPDSPGHQHVPGHQDLLPRPGTSTAWQVP